MNKLDQFEQLILASWPLAISQQVDCCVGLSGGIDSVVLLSGLAKLRTYLPIRLSAVHVNHGISPHADQWQAFCQDLCQTLGVELLVTQLKVRKISGQGLENSARKLRYHAFAQTGIKLIALAHHQNDQIETMLSQIIRGSDVHNIAAMKAYSQRQHQAFWRPLLNLPKTAIISYATTWQLPNIEDESNQNQHYLRNFLRQQIIPQLTSYDQDAVVKLLNSLASIQQAVQLNDELAALDLKFCQQAENQLGIADFSTLSAARQKNLLSYYIRQNNLAIPSSRQLKEFIHQITNAAADRHPQLKIAHNAQIARNKHSIVLTICQ